MTTVFRSTEMDPLARGQEFGRTFAERIKANVEVYGKMFDRLSGGGYDVAEAGRQALEKTLGFAPALHQEMLGIAEGAGLDPSLIGAINARTEILAAIKAGSRGECSAVIHLDSGFNAPLALQTWDWYHAMGDLWLVWEIPLEDGTITKTMTEYGIVGKSGLNTRGIGVLFTILHHEEDGGEIGVPLHVASRAVMDEAPNIFRAAQRLASIEVSASSSLNLAAFEGGIGRAISVEMHPGGPSFVMPDADGFIVHTNHFLAPGPAARDTEPRGFPDTLLRYDYLRRSLGAFGRPSVEDVLGTMRRHEGGEGAVCCRPEPGEDPDMGYETLSTVIFDLPAGDLTVLKGWPS